MFDRLFRFFIAILPWSVIISVFLGYKLGIPGINFIKEILLVLLIASVGYEYCQKKQFPKFDILDYLIGGYIISLVAITLGNHLGVANIIYGGRYDFEFLIAFLTIKHGAQFLKAPISAYVKLFLSSASIALVFSILVRFVFGETILLHFGYSPNLSNWSFGGAPPIYHGIEGANVRRFQGIFDGPNPAAYFILVYLGLFLHYFRTKKEYHFIAWIWILVLLGLVFLTYSRSSLLGLIVGVGILILLSLRTIIKKHKKAALVSLLIFSMLAGVFYLKYADTMDRIILREGSSKGHFDRAITGLKRFREHPLGQGLATSGPAYRYIDKPTGDSLYDDQNKKTEDYYIPESWYIQQLVEWGIIGTILFLAIMGYITVLVYATAPMLFAAFIAVLTMNAFLHTFESVYVSLILFSFIGLFIGRKKNKTPQKYHKKTSI